MSHNSDVKPAPDDEVPPTAHAEDQTTDVLESADCSGKNLNIGLAEQERETESSSSSSSDSTTPSSSSSSSTCTPDTTDESYETHKVVVNFGGLTVEEALALLLKARSMNCNNVVAELVEVVTKELAEANCVNIFKWATRCQQKELRVAAQDMICRNFIVLSEMCDEFCLLSVEELNVIVKSDILNATEEQVFNAIVRWISSELQERHSFISTLLPAVRVDRCSLRFLQNAASHCLVKNEEPFLEAAKKRMRYLVSAGLTQDRVGNEPRVSGSHVLFVMGGYNNVKTVETLDSTRSSWVAHAIPDAPSDWTWICSTGRLVLVLDTEHKNFTSFNVKTKMWTKLPPPPYYSYGSSKCFSEQHIYVLGGMDETGTRIVNYDVRTEEWTEMTPLSHGKVFAATVVHAGKLYCCGGLSATKHDVPASLEVLELEKNNLWRMLAPMAFRRVDHSMVYSGRYLWVIGGRFDRECLSAVEKYDLESGQWTTVSPLPKALNCSSASVFEGRIYVIGGEVGGFDAVSSVYVYDKAEDEWTTRASLHERRFYHGSCVVQFSSDEAAGQYRVPTE